MSAPTLLRLGTWNLRYDVQPDSITVAESLAALPDPCIAPPQRVLRGERPWSARRVRVAQRLQASRVDLLGFQEALIRQVRDLEKLLGGEYAWVGVGRSDGIEDGEFSPIFYRRTTFTLLTTDTFWLSHTPFTPGSLFPGAGCPRLATAGTPPRDIALINTHLDHASDAQRQLGAAMVLHRARYEVGMRPGVPVFVTGDLNSSASGSDRGAYAILTGGQRAPPVPDEFTRHFPLPSSPSPNPSFPGEKEELVMRDLRDAAPRAFVGGKWATFTGFEHNNADEACIDFVFGRKDGGWEAKGVFVETALSDDGMLASDHRLVVADIVIS
ncbi:mannose-6-phosphatase [Lactifluus subvellereus]|nr:mannose-6-phosphatase [Lactifluus subvellereus]